MDSGSSPSDATGPLEQRVVSKNWQARSKAFEEITAMFNAASNPAEDCFRDHSGQWKKYLGDNNPGSLEKCLDALLAFIEKSGCKMVQSTQNEIIRSLIDKCLGHVKASIKSKAMECFLLCFEVSESFDDSQEPVIEMLNSKQ